MSMKRLLSGLAHPLTPLSGILLLALALSVQTARCEDTPLVDDVDLADDIEAAEVEAFQQAAVYAGYRFISPVDNPSLAAPYLRLKSGVSGGFSAGTVGTDLKLSADAQFLHPDDYNADLTLDYSGLYRLALHSSSLWHNLERLPSASIAPEPGQDQDSGSVYGVRTVISQAKNRFKLGNNPIHLNLNYWQLVREGKNQLLFSDFDFESNFNLRGATARPVTVDSITREGTVALDGHLGPVNAAYSFTIRDFSNQAPDSRDVFSGSALPQAHNVIDDSRSTTHTFKLFSDLSGGLTTSALYSISQSESAAERGDARPSSAPAVTLQTASGDISYTPFHQLSLNLKYRRLQIDRETADSVSSAFVQSLTPGTLSLKPAIDSVRDTLIFSVSYRPVPKVSYRFEYRAELETRDNLPDYINDGTKSESRQTHTGKASFIWKPLNGVRLNAAYSYAANDHPAYPSSFGERHNGQALISYASSGRWGISASYLGRFESADSNYQQTRLPRESLSSSANGTLWFSPLERLTVNAGYSFQRLKVEQANIFDYDGNPIPPIRTAGSYRTTAHVYSLDMVAAVTKFLDLSLALQQTFADISFSATDNSPDPAYSAAGIGDYARLLSTTTALTTRADLRLNKHLGCSLGYSFRAYHAGQPLFDGAAHETLLNLTGRW